MQWDVDISKKRRERPLEVERLMKDLISRLDEDESMEEDAEVDVDENGMTPLVLTDSLLLMHIISSDSAPLG